MKISELVERLIKIKEVYGDLEVATDEGYGGTYNLESANICESKFGPWCVLYGYDPTKS